VSSNTSSVWQLSIRRTLRPDEDFDELVMTMVEESLRTPHAERYQRLQSICRDPKVLDLIKRISITRDPAMDGMGYAAALHLKLLQGIKTEWVASDFVFEAGGVL
jgi:hypothetical protein